MSLGPSPKQELIDRQNKLDELMKEFLAKGGKIEKIPEGMTGEQYYNLKKGTNSGKRKKKQSR
jgi:hypothetical protein